MTTRASGLFVLILRKVSTPSISGILISVKMRLKAVFRDISTASIPLDARVRIDELFRKVAAGDAEPNELKAELDRWDVFEEYQDQFLKLFKKK